VVAIHSHHGVCGDVGVIWQVKSVFCWQEAKICGEVTRCPLAVAVSEDWEMRLYAVAVRHLRILASSSADWRYGDRVTS